MIVDLAVIGAATLILLAVAVPVLAWDVRDRWRRGGQQLEALIDATREPPLDVQLMGHRFGEWPAGADIEEWEREVNQ